MIDERLMQPGRWSLRLKPETPLAIRSGIAWRDHFVVTPGRMQLPTYDAVLSDSIYTGVVLERQRGGPSESVSFSGINMLYWMGDTQVGIGSGVTDGFRSETITTLLNELWTTPQDVGGFTLTLSSVPSTTVVDIVENETRDVTAMQMIDRWRRKTDANTEFAMRHSGEMVFSEEGAGSAFVQTPTLLVTRDGVTGVSGAYRNVQASSITETADAYDEDYSADVKATDGLSTEVVTNSGFSGRRVPDMSVNTNGRTRWIYTGEVSGAGAAQDFSCGMIGYAAMRYQRRRISIELGAGAVIPNIDIAVGDYIYVLDPFTGAVDTANEVYANGTELHPQKLRVTGLSWGPQTGHAVWWLKTQSGDGDGTKVYNVADITEWVDEWDAPTRLEIDTAPPLRPPAFRSSKLS